jgi:transposase InsO family protein
MKLKSQVADILIGHLEMLKNKFRRKPKIFRSDNGGEYVCAKVQNYLKREGIQIQYTVPYSAFQNGISERRNRTLMDAAKSIIFGASLEDSYWAEAVSYANFIQNR